MSEPTRNLKERPTTSTLVTFSVEFHATGARSEETQSVGAWLGLGGRALAEMSWEEIEAELEALAETWAIEHISSGWGPAKVENP